MADIRAEVLQEASRLMDRIGPLLGALGVATGAGDIARALELNLEIASLSEAHMTLIASLGAATILKPSNSADRASLHLSMAADTLLDQNRVAEMEEIEAKSMALAERWCGSLASLDLRHNQAIRARSRGRFAVALAAFAELRDAAVVAGVDEVAWRATLARAETLQWLGDPARGLEELDRVNPPELRKPVMSLGAKGWMERMRAVMEAGNIVELKAMEAATREWAATKNWHLLRFLCLRDLAEHDSALWPAAAAELSIVARDSREKGDDIAADFYEAQFMLVSGQADRALLRADGLAVRFAASQQFQHRQGSVAILRARALRALGRLTEARDAAREGAEMLTMAGQEESVWRAWLLLAETTDDPGERSTALAAGTAAVERMRLAPLGWRLDNLFLAARMPLYRAAIAEACTADDGSRALGLIEAVKSRALTAVLGDRRDNGTQADIELVRQHAELDATIARMQVAVLVEAHAGAAAISLQAKRRERAELAERLRQADPRWRTLTAPDSASPSDIAAAVRSLGVVALDLFFSDGVLATVCITKGAIQVDRRNLQPQTMLMLERFLQGLAPQPLEDGTPRPPNPLLRDPRQLGLSLDAFLPPVMVTEIASAQRVLIAAHGPLHLLPWPVLPITPEGQRLIELTEVGLLPNLGCLPALAARDAGTSWCAVIGAPERDFGPENSRRVERAAVTTAIEVAALHAARNQLVAPPFIGREATISAFDALCAQPLSADAILHVTSHGEPPRSEPGDAALLLADANLEAAAISRARLPFAEVVLSACSTGFRPTAEAQGIQLWGDDALGLPGAFLEAGVAALLVSIPLAEVTAAHRIAINYHTARLSGEPPLTAFRTAQRALLSDPSIRERNACGFVLYGCR